MSFCFTLRCLYSPFNRLSRSVGTTVAAFVDMWLNSSSSETNINVYNTLCKRVTLIIIDLKNFPSLDAMRRHSPEKILEPRGNRREVCVLWHVMTRCSANISCQQKSGNSQVTSRHTDVNNWALYSCWSNGQHPFASSSYRRHESSLFLIFLPPSIASRRRLQADNELLVRQGC